MTKVNLTATTTWDKKTTQVRPRSANQINGISGERRKTNSPPLTGTSDVKRRERELHRRNMPLIHLLLWYFLCLSRPTTKCCTALHTIQHQHSDGLKASPIALKKWQDCFQHRWPGSRKHLVILCCKQVSDYCLISLFYLISAGATKWNNFCLCVCLIFIEMCLRLSMREKPPLLQCNNQLSPHGGDSN